MIYELPTGIDIQGIVYKIRSDYRAILDICMALSDPELDDQEKAVVALTIFYPDIEDMPTEHYRDALDACFHFIDCDSEDGQTQKVPKLMDWEQDFRYIIAPVNRVLGQEIRAVDYMHWWTFIGAYYEIGDCLFAQIVRIRDLKARGKKLDKSDQEFYRRNKQLIDLKTTYTEQEESVLNSWLR